MLSTKMKIKVDYILKEKEQKAIKGGTSEVIIIDDINMI